MVTVDIFKTSVVFQLSGFQYRETKPVYAAMVPGDQHYFCFCEELKHLPRQLALAKGLDEIISPQNLLAAEDWKEINFGDSYQAVLVRHEPLTSVEWSDFMARAISEIGIGYNLSQRTSEECDALRQKLTEEGEIQSWLNEGGK